MTDQPETQTAILLFPDGRWERVDIKKPIKEQPQLYAPLIEENPDDIEMPQLHQIDFALAGVVNGEMVFIPDPDLKGRIWMEALNECSKTIRRVERNWRYKRPWFTFR